MSSEPHFKAFRRSSIIVASIVAMLLSSLALALNAPAADAQGDGCFLATSEGNVIATWTEIPGATLYVYRLEVPGSPNRYDRVPSTIATIAAPSGARVTVAVSGVFADGSYSAAVPCGSITNSVDPNPPPTGDGCFLATAEGNVIATWTEVPGADQYVYRVEVPGSPNRYGRVPSTTATIPAPSSARVTVAVSAVFADGSYSPAIPCGSITNSVDPNPNPTGDGCFLALAGDEIVATWTVLPNVPRYVWRLSIEGQPNRYGQVERSTARIPLQPGARGNVAVSAINIDGSYGPLFQCGSITNPGA